MTNTGKNKVIAINAYCGSGKTHYILRHVLKYIETNNERHFLLISPNNSLNQEMVSKIKNVFNIDIKSHLDKNVKAGDNIITSLESLIKSINRAGDNFGTIICDEFEAILSHLESTTIKTDKERMDIFSSLCNILQQAERVIVLDANISKYRIDLLKNILRVKNIPLYRFKTNDYLEYQHNIIVDSKVFGNMLLDDYVEKKKRIVMATDTKTKSKHLNLSGIDLSKIIGEVRNILLINSDGLTITRINGDEVTEIISPSSNPDDKAEFYKNIETTLIKNDIHFFIYSPCITAGISINAEIFDVLYCHFTCLSICVREMFQMLYRSRHLKDKTINMYFGRKTKHLVKTIPLDVFHKFCEEPNKILMKDTFELDSMDEFKYSKDDLYYKTRVVNRIEMKESGDNPHQVLYTLMTYNNDVPLNFIYKSDKRQLLKDMSKYQQNLDYMAYLDIDLMYNPDGIYDDDADIFLNIPKFNAIYKQVKEQQKLKDNTNQSENIEYSFYFKFMKLINASIITTREDSGEDVIFKSRGYFKYRDIINNTWSDNPPYSLNNYTPLIKISVKWINHVSSRAFFDKCIGDYITRIVKSQKKISNHSNDNKKYYVTPIHTGSDVIYDKMCDRINAEIKAKVFDVFTQNLPKQMTAVERIDNKYLRRFIGSSYMLNNENDILNYEYSTIYNPTINIHVFERVLGMVKDQSIITNGDMWQFFTIPEIINNTNDIYRILKPNYKDREYICKKEQFYTLYKILKYGGYNTQYVDTTHTTKRNDKIKITLDGLYYRSDYKYIQKSTRFEPTCGNIVFQNTIDKKSVNISIPSEYLRRYHRYEYFTKEHIKENNLTKLEVKTNKGYVDDAQEVCFKARATFLNPSKSKFTQVNLTKTDRGKRTIKYRHTDEAVGVSLPLYKNVVKRFNQPDYIYYTPYQVRPFTANVGLCPLIKDVDHKGRSVFIIDSVISYVFDDIRAYYKRSYESIPY